MKKHNLLAVVFAAAIAFTACKKNDVQASNVQKTSASADWKSLSNWSSESEEGYKAYNSTVQDTSISASVASNGLVLAYKKTGNIVVALPVEDKASNGSYFWYYQVSEGSISFSADAYGNAPNPGTNQTFKYFILSPEKLSELETKGYTKAELMKLTYENATALLK